MAHFAQVVNGRVVTVIVAEPEVIDEWNLDIIKDNLYRGGPGDCWYSFGWDIGAGKWVQTSFNTRGGKHYKPRGPDHELYPLVEDDGIPLRKNFAVEGGIYDEERDAFYEPQPYPSWILNEDSCLWDPPIPLPLGDDWPNGAIWDEELYQSDNTKGWVHAPPGYYLMSSDEEEPFPPCKECIPNPEDL